MMGLRLDSGGSFRANVCCCASDNRSIKYSRYRSNAWRSLGLLEWASYNGEMVLRLTSKGRLLGNQVFMEFI